jgi:hypothetical protein
MDRPIMFGTDRVTANGENGIRAFRLNFIHIRWQWMGFQPQRASDGGRIDTGLIPPRGFITGGGPGVRLRKRQQKKG